MQCDFCDSLEPVWRYPCRTFEAPILLGLVVPLSEGDWAACERCHSLIEERNYLALAMRAAASSPWVAMEVVTAGEVMPWVLKLHADFRANRKGPAVRV